MKVMRRWWIKLPLLVFFPSIRHGLAIIVPLTDEHQELCQYWPTYSQTVNLVFIKHTSTLIYMFNMLHIMYIYICIYIYIYYTHIYISQSKCTDKTHKTTETD